MNRKQRFDPLGILPPQKKRQRKGKRRLRNGQKRPTNAMTMQRVLAMNRIGRDMERRVQGAKSEAARRLAIAMGMPHEGTLRFPTADVPRSSVSTLTDEWAVSNPTTAANGFVAGDLLFAFFGQLGRLAMIYQPLVTGSGDILFPVTGSPITSSKFVISYPVIKSGDVHNCDETVNLLGARVAGNTSYGPHGTLQPAGTYNAEPFMWFNVGDKMRVSWTSSLAQCEAYFATRRFRSPTETPDEEGQYGLVLTSTPDADDIFTCTQPGYYSFKFLSLYNGAATATTPGELVFNMSITWAATSGWAQVSMADLNPFGGGDPNIAECCRVNSASLLVTNVTAPLIRQGMVLAARMQQVPFWDVNQAILGRASEKYQGDACNGVYTFHAFTQDREVFTKCCNSTIPIFDLGYEGFYHFIKLSNQSPATTANNFAVKFDTMLEFVTDIGRYSKDTSQFSFDDLLEARSVISATPIWFYENPTHAARIYGWIKRALGKVGNVARTVAPYALDGATMAYPESAPLIQALKHLILR
jgi:hypothetical protein